MKRQLTIFSDRWLQKHFLIGLLLVCLSFISFSQGNVQEIGNAFKHGDAQELSKYFDKQIDLTFSDKTTTCSKKQAEIIVQKFFSKVEPNNFANLQRGTSQNNNTKFILGDMSTSNGVYKVYMFFIQKKGVYLLRELRFEK